MTSKGLSFLLGLTVLICSAVTYAQLGPMYIDFPVFQEGAPLVVVGVSGSISRLDLANEVDLVNVSDKTITGYQLGWVITGDKQAGPGVPFYGMRLDANLRPGELLTTSGQGVTFSSVQATRRSGNWTSARVVIGVVYVKFEGGKEWSYPLWSMRSFPEKDDPVLHQRIDPIVKALIDRKNAQKARQSSSIRKPGFLMPTKSSCSSARNSLAALFDSVFSLLEATPMHAACTPCWLVVCNPAFRQCNNDDPDPGVCFSTPCPLDGFCNYAQCGFIPTCC